MARGFLPTSLCQRCPQKRNQNPTYVTLLASVLFALLTLVRLGRIQHPPAFDTILDVLATIRPRDRLHQISMAALPVAVERNQQLVILLAGPRVDEAYEIAIAERAASIFDRGLVHGAHSSASRVARLPEFEGKGFGAQQSEDCEDGVWKGCAHHVVASVWWDVEIWECKPRSEGSCTSKCADE